MQLFCQYVSGWILEFLRFLFDSNGKIQVSLAPFYLVAEELEPMSRIGPVAPMPFNAQRL
jgi:hypothetical protein